jgi:Flp pilus assembly protein CpaB
VKRISPATVTFGVMALVLGLVAAYIVRQSLQKPVIVKPPVPKKAPVVDPGIPVVIARNNLPKHTQIAADDLRVVRVPRGTKAAEGTVPSAPYAEGRIVTKAIKAGQVIREENLLGVGEGLPDLAERLPAGHRAVTIDVQGAETGGEPLAEGDLVDISLTVEGDHPDLGEVTTRTLLHGVLVVDAEANGPVVRNSKEARSGRRQTDEITVAVKPADANKLVVAQRTGTLSVALVSAQDAVQPAADDADAISRRELLGLKEITPPPAPKKYTVEKWTGSTVRIIEMTDDRVRESRDVTPSGQPTQATSLENKTSFVPQNFRHFNSRVAVQEN